MRFFLFFQKCLGTPKRGEIQEYKDRKQGIQFKSLEIYWFTATASGLWLERGEQFYRKCLSYICDRFFLTISVGMINGRTYEGYYTISFNAIIVWRLQQIDRNTNRYLTDGRVQSSRDIQVLIYDLVPIRYSDSPFSSMTFSNCESFGRNCIRNFVCVCLYQCRKGL